MKIGYVKYLVLTIGWIGYLIMVWQNTIMAIGIGMFVTSLIIYNAGLTKNVW